MPEAGRELDAQVAEKVMGWTEVKFQPIANAMGQHVIDEWMGRGPNDPYRNALVPKYSTQMQYAGEVLEKMRSQYQFVALISGRGGQPWVCKVNRESGFFEEKAPTAPLAVCLAALRGVAPT
ncbi:MAG TPA: hypothetical protein VEJ18_01640 [Planctomycetota bacterium]|nr:hypothetical protein [Planctomycetota bacterium]